MAILEVNRRKQWFRANWKKKRKKQGTHTCNMAQKKLKQKQCAHEFVRRGLGFSLGLILPVFFRNTSKADKKKRSWELRRPIGERKSKNSKRRSPKTRTTTKRNHAAVPNETIIKIIAIKKEKKTRATQKVKIEDGEGIGRTRKKKRCSDKRRNFGGMVWKRRAHWQQWVHAVFTEREENKTSDASP